MARADPCRGDRTAAVDQLGRAVLLRVAASSPRLGCAHAGDRGPLVEALERPGGGAGTVRASPGSRTAGGRRPDPPWSGARGFPVTRPGSVRYRAGRAPGRRATAGRQLDHGRPGARNHPFCRVCSPVAHREPCPEHPFSALPRCDDHRRSWRGSHRGRGQAITASGRDLVLDAWVVAVFAVLMVAAFGRARQAGERWRPVTSQVLAGLAIFALAIEMAGFSDTTLGTARAIATVALLGTQIG